jgi:uncharacterized protein involved in exopolysaccharide biosynthesis
MSEGAPTRARALPAQEDAVAVQPNVESIPANGDFTLERQLFVNRQRLVWENRTFSFKAAAIGLILSTALAFLIPNRFESTARLMPPDQSGSGMGMAMLAMAGGGGAGSQLGSSSSLGSMVGDLLGLKGSSDLFVGVLQSRTVQDDLINKFNLRDVYWDRRMEDARKDLGKHTTVSADRKSGIISIQVEDKSPQRAAAMAGEYVSELNQMVTQLNTSSAHRERVFLEDRLVQVNRDLEAAEKNFSEFASKNTALDIPTQGRAMIEASAQLEGQLIAAETELQGLRQVYADGNVRVRAMQARVDELQHELKKNLGSESGDPLSSNTSKGAGRQNQQSLFPTIRQLPVLGVGYADLYRNTRVEEAIFQVLTQEYELAKVEEAKETPSIKVLDSPYIPDKKSFPPRLLIIALGTMLSVAVGICWVFGKNSWDQTEQGDPQKELAQEVIHAIRSHTPWSATNGSKSNANGNEIWNRSSRTQDQTKSDR